jgi:hypothetical protein
LPVSCLPVSCLPVSRLTEIKLGSVFILIYPIALLTALEQIQHRTAVRALREIQDATSPGQGNCS